MIESTMSLLLIVPMLSLLRVRPWGRCGQLHAADVRAGLYRARLDRVQLRNFGLGLWSAGKADERASCVVLDRCEPEAAIVGVIDERERVERRGVDAGGRAVNPGLGL